MVSTKVRLGDITLDNPIIPASGTFGYGREFADYYDINKLGAISVKGTTLSPRYGNPQPRIAEAPAGMLNAVGLQNPGIDAVLTEELPELRRIYKNPVILNVGGFSESEYAEVVRRACASPNVDIIELNISCPNVHDGGMSFGTVPRDAARVVSAVRAVCRLPLFVKLTPNVTDIVSVARACSDAGADGICLINTLLSMRVDIRTRKPLLANLTGGLSGPAVFPVALRMIWQVYEAVDIPIIGCGGVATAENAIEMMLAGAAAVEVGAANLINPYACSEIIDELPAVMTRYGINNLNDIIGGAHK